MADIQELTDETFATGVANGVVLVDFYGTYCPPCKMLEPVIEQLAQDFSGRATIARINVDDNAEAAVDNMVEDIPTLVFFKDGEAVARLFGAQKMETLAEELNHLLK
ncbi:MAG: thioredoxin family protein [Planctomycetaceae bacterium]|nr:thioredoxin family protein [Planctomycetaceae bacterium]